MANKTINGRIQQKHDTEVNWTKAANFIPKAGEVIVYDRDGLMDVERIKVGDGIHTANELPFIFEPVTRDDIDAICGVADLISFSIQNAIYQAVQGMTWKEWTVSKYNTANFYAYDGTGNTYVYQDNTLARRIIHSETRAYVSKEELIQNNGVYTFDGAADPE